MLVIGKKNFGLKEAQRSLAFAKSRGKKLTPDVAFGIQVAVAGLGFQNTASKEARDEAQRQAKLVSLYKTDALSAEATGAAKASGLRQRCDNVVATVRELAEKVVTTVTNHYRAAVARAETRAEAKAAACYAEAGAAAEAEAKAAEIADLF